MTHDTSPELEAAYETVSALRIAAQDAQAHLFSALQHRQRGDADAEAGAIFNARRAMRRLADLTGAATKKTSRDATTAAIKAVDDACVLDSGLRFLTAI